MNENNKGRSLKAAGRYLYQEGTVYIILVALIIFFSIVNPKFLSSRNLYNLITLSTYIVIAGMGICFVMISGGIDLSVGYQMAVCGCVAAIIMLETTLPFWVVWPVCIVLGCRSAVRYLRENAAEYHLDPSRFAAIGGSAGGNLAAMLGMNVPNVAFPGEGDSGSYAAEPSVGAAVAQFGPMNFRTMDEQARRNGVSNVDHDEPFSPESRYLGCPIPDASEALCAAADPASYAGPRMCPIYVQHGTRDRLVPYEQSVEFVRALRERGVGERVSFQPLEGADHEDKAFFTDENLNHVRAFLEAVLGEGNK